MNIIGPGMLACVDVTFKFHGKPAHAAAAAHRGISALDAMILAFVAINGTRQFLRDGNRVHGIITKGGDAPNIVPDYCEAAFIVRSPTVVELEETKRKVYQAARGAAESVGARFEYVEGLTYAELNNNDALGRLFTQNMAHLGIEMVEPRVKGGGGSSDIGNVSQVTAAIHPYVKISDVASNHTPEFCVASASEEAMLALNQSAKAMAMTALDLCLDSPALQLVRDEYLEWKGQ